MIMNFRLSIGSKLLIPFEQPHPYDETNYTKEGKGNGWRDYHPPRSFIENASDTIGEHCQRQ